VAGVFDKACEDLNPGNPEACSWLSSPRDALFAALGLPGEWAAKAKEAIVYALGLGATLFVIVAVSKAQSFTGLVNSETSFRTKAILPLVTGGSTAAIAIALINKDRIQM
jgi:hypothetical protein